MRSGIVTILALMFKSAFPQDIVVQCDGMDGRNILVCEVSEDIVKAIEEKKSKGEALPSFDELFSKAKAEVMNPQFSHYSTGHIKAPIDPAFAPSHWEYGDVSVVRINKLGWFSTERKLSRVFLFSFTFQSKDEGEILARILVVEDGTILPLIRRPLTKAELEWFSSKR